MTTFWCDRTVLVTGGSGFLGANLCRALVDRGAVVHVAELHHAQSSPGMRVLGVAGQVEMHEVDVTDWRAVQGLPPTSVVFHLAGMSKIPNCREYPRAAVATNILGTANVLEWCRQGREAGRELAAVVVASSNHVYGRCSPASGPFHEREGLLQDDIYGATKGCADLLARAYAREYGLPVVALRHVNAYGPADPHASHLVPATILSLLSGEQPVIKSDGTPAKAYLYVADLIEAYLAAAEAAATRNVTGAFNVAPPFSDEAPISVRDLVARIIEVAGVDVEPLVTKEDLSQAGYFEALEASLFRTMTGWSARTSLTLGLAKTYRWYADHGGMEWTR